MHSRLRIDGWAINVKRTYRLYREEGLMLRKGRRKKLLVLLRCKPWASRSTCYENLGAAHPQPIEQIEALVMRVHQSPIRAAPKRP